jgi:L-ascorbate metabolism protein UlaG (beta-lactamase superfamily)
MAKLLYQGHGSFRITTEDNVVIYVDPYAGKGYEQPADIILVTHQHGDHNQLKLVTKKPGCTIIQNQDALKNGSYQSFTVRNILIQAVPAYNRNHDRRECVGYILLFDGLKLYATGDTSTTEEMKTFTSIKLDYVLLPIDGYYNMGPEEASDCADMMEAKHAIPIHMMPGALFDEKQAEKFTARNRMIIRPGEEISL